MTQPPDIETTKAFNAKIADEFRANDGKVRAFEGNELLLLTTTGAKSGAGGGFSNIQGVKGGSVKACD